MNRSGESMEDAVIAAIAVLIVTVLALYLTNLSWIGSKRQYRYPFIGIMISEMLIGWSYFLGINADVLGDKLMLNNFEYLGYLGAPFFYLIFVLQYTGSKSIGKRETALWAIPIVIFELVIATNSYHHLYYETVSMPSDPLLTFDMTTGPLYYLFGCYTFVVILMSIIVLARQYLRAPDAFKKGIGLVILTGMISLVTVLLYFLAFRDAPSGLILLIGFAIANVPLFIGAFRFRIFEMLPFANERVISTMRGGVVILDNDDNVLFLNKSAETISGSKIDAVYQHPMSNVFPKFPVSSFIRPRDEDEMRLSVVEVEGMFYETEVRTIEDQTGNSIGKLVRIRDVTDIVRTDEEMRRAEKLLSILNSITRHDIRNQLISLEGHLSLMKTEDPALKRHLEASIRSAHAIEDQLEFAKDYQEIGGKAPVWQSIDDTVGDIKRSLDLKNINVRLETGCVEILADPLFGKVFYSLIDDSLMHGGHVANISFKISKNEEGLDIIYEDDGIGIRDVKKEIIFEKGYGKNTGLGLFLSREILRISNMSIVENGVEGKGARFVIRVPKGRYRFPGSS